MEKCLYAFVYNDNKIFLLRSPISNSEQGSEVVFGGIDDSHYTGQITWIPLTSETYWQIKMDRCKHITVY